MKRFHHPVVGDLDLPFESMQLEAGSSISLVTYLPAPHSPSADALEAASARLDRGELTTGTRPDRDLSVPGVTQPPARRWCRDRG